MSRVTLSSLLLLYCRRLLTLCLLFILSGTSIYSQEQEFPFSPFDDRKDSTIFYALKQIQNAYLPISYMTIPMIGLSIEPVERIYPLRLGEGVKNYILEGITDLTFPLMQGRNLSNYGWQTSRLSFRYAPGVRMTRDNSSNLIPTNQKVGLQYEKVLWDSYSKIRIWDTKGQTARLLQSNWADEKKGLTAVSLIVLALHYSNGQAEGVYASPADSVAGRNDYIKGDFSTNLIQAALNISRYSQKRNLTTMQLGYQWDGNWRGPFSYHPEQEGRYGHHRLVGFAQYYTRPHRHPLGCKSYIWDPPCNKRGTRLTISGSIDSGWTTNTYWGICPGSTAVKIIGSIGTCM